MDVKPLIKPKDENLHVFMQRVLSLEGLEDVIHVAPVCDVGFKLMRRIFTAFHYKGVRFVRGEPVAIHKCHLLIDGRRYRIITVQHNGRAWFALKDFTHEQFRPASTADWVKASIANGIRRESKGNNGDWFTNRFFAEKGE